MKRKLATAVRNWVNELRAASPKIDGQAAGVREETGQRPFQLESLEPRLLLSGDPVLAELARWVEDGGNDSDAKALSVIIQEMDQAAADQLSAGVAGDAPDRADLTVAWPEEWAESDGPDYLMASGAPDAPPSIDSVTQAQLDAALTAAIDAWRDSPLGLNSTILDTISITAGDLSGTSVDLLASTTGTEITIDDNAAGRGWYTVGEAESERAGNIDLVSVVAHEIGHILGQEHAASAGDVMSSTLAEGVSVLPGGSAPLNDVIDAVLAGFGDTVPVGEQVFTTAPGQTVTIGSTLNDGDDLVLEGVTLRFSNLSGGPGNWSGDVVIEAISGTLFSGLLDISLVDDGTAAGDDPDEFAVTGSIGLETGNSASLAIDDFNLETLGLPTLFTFSIDSISVNFDDFRASDEINDLRLNLAIDAIDTGNAAVNDLLKSELGFALKIDADLDLTLAVDEIEASAQAAMTGDAVGAITAAFAAAVESNINAFELGVDGTFPGVGSFSGKLIYALVTGDGANSDESAEYLAIDASISLTPEFLGIEVPEGEDPPAIPQPKFGFAISSLGPLQAYIGGENTLPDITGQGYVISGLNVGVRFSTSIEGLQTGVDYTVNAAQVEVTAGTQVELTLEGHDFEAGDELRFTHDNPQITEYNGVYEVDSVTDDTVLYTLAATPSAAFAGTASIVRQTIKDPFDLRDAGLASGILPPSDVDNWKIQLDNAVKQQIADGASWINVGNLLDNVLLGGGGTVTFTGVEDTVLKVSANVLLGLENLTTPEDLKASLLLAGTLVVNDGVPEAKFEAPAKLYGKFDATTVEARFLILGDLPGANATKGITPILVLRGEASFAATPTGFAIDYTGGVDLNVPNPAAADPLTTVTLEGNVDFDFSLVGNTTRIDLAFDVSLSETFAGLIGLADGKFHLLVATDADGDVSDVELWGAAILTVDDTFLNEYGLFTDVSGLIKINTTDSAKPDELLNNSQGGTVAVTLPASTFALRVDGDVEFQISGNKAFEIDGTFVLELSGAQGFNVAIFSEEGGEIDPATLKIGPDGFLEYGVLGFLAIRSDGIAANLGLTGTADLFGLAELNAAAVLVVNTTGRRLDFEVPPSPNASLEDVPTVFSIPARAPQDPSSILAAPSSGSGDLGLNALLDGSPEWTEGASGPYGVVFIEGSMDLLGVLEFDLSGHVLLSSSVFSLEANFYAGGDFLGLASASVGGTVFFSSEGEFFVAVNGDVQLGPDWININGSAYLEISYLDENGRASGGTEPKQLDIEGALDVGLTIDIDPFPAVDITLAALEVGYVGSTGAITVGVGYPEPFWDEECVDLGFLGTACIPFPNVREATYTFTVGTLKVDTPPPIVLAQIGSEEGVLEVNAGVAAGARNLLPDEVDEDVTIAKDGDVVTITMFGVTQEFENVDRVLIRDMSGGNDTVVIDSTVDIPVEVHFGDGRDALRSNGTAMVTAYGDGGNDRLEGGTAGDILDGGADDDIVDGGLGADSVSGGVGNGDDTFIWNIGDGQDASIVGGGGNDLLRTVGKGGEALVAEVTKNGSGFNVAVGGVTLMATQVEQLNITGRDLADTINIRDLSGTDLRRISIDLGNDDDQQDSVIVDLSVTNASDIVNVRTDLSQRPVAGNPNGLEPEFEYQTVTDENGNEFNELLSVTPPTIGTEEVRSAVLTLNDTLEIGVSEATSALTGGDKITVNTFGGADTVNVIGTLAGTETYINTGAGGDTINLRGETVVKSDQGPNKGAVLSVTPLNNIDEINGLVDVDGGTESDSLNVNDAANIGDKVGTLTAATLRGLGLEAGVDYAEIESLDIRLGTGADDFFIASTHAGATTLRAGSGSAAPGERDDTIAIDTISGVTTVLGQGGDDAVHVNVNEDLTRTHENGIDIQDLGSQLSIDGGEDSDDVTANLAGDGDAIINVLDTGTAGADTLTVNGADTGSAYEVDDTFLLRKDFVALINGDDVERVNYNSNINERLTVNGLAGDDKIVVDDNSTETTLDGGSGDDTFQVGQVFATPRDANASVGAGDEFDTTAIIIGEIRNPDPDSDKYELDEVIFDPSEFDVVEDELSAEKAADIAAAVEFRKNQGLNEVGYAYGLDGLAYVSDGVSHETTILGGDDNDDFNIYHNKAALELEGNDGNDDFVVRAFVTVSLPGQSDLAQAESNVNGGDGSDVIQYAINAPVNIDGGDGFDTLVVLGTPFGDNFVVTATSIYGAGLSVSFANLESVELDTLEGNDTVYVLGTTADAVTTVIGGLGSDDINVMGDVVKTVVGGSEQPSSDPVDQNLEAIAGPLVLEGGPVEGRDRSLQAPVVLPGERGDGAVQNSPTRDESTDIDTLSIFHTDNQETQEDGRLYYRDGSAGVENEGLALTGFGLGGDKTFDITEEGETRSETYGGGITLNAFESVEILLGSGDETLVIDETGDRDEKNSAAPDPATITAVHGGGGSDNITINGRGNGPLVVYGDTSENGERYSNGSEDVSENGSAFANPGADTIDASGLENPDDGFASVVIYGGDGDDEITGSQGDDHIAGGAGSDTINGEFGNDHIYGDSQFNVDVDLFNQDQQQPLTVQSDIDNMFEVVTTGVADASIQSDTINAGQGNDVVFGDHGVIAQVDGTRRIETTGEMVSITTIKQDDGDADTVHGDGGNDILFGGRSGDTVFGDNGHDLIFGDFGSVAAQTAATIGFGQIGAVDGAGVINENELAKFTYSSDTSDDANTNAGADTLYGGSKAVGDTDNGDNIILGQQDGDTIYGGGSDDDIYGGHPAANGLDGDDVIDAAAGDDVIVGDNGIIERSSTATDPRFTELTGDEIYDEDDVAQVANSKLVGSNPEETLVRYVKLFDHNQNANNHVGNFGADTIAGGADDDVIFGQLGNDMLHGDGAIADGILGSLDQTIAGSDVGGDDYIEGNGGSDTVYGGLGQDDIVGGSSSLYNLGNTAQRPDADDTLFGGNGDEIDRNDFGDELHARDSDVILGDNGNIYRLVELEQGVSIPLSFNYDDDYVEQIVVRAAELLDYTPGGADADIGAGDSIRGESGDDFIYGMTGDDVLFGDAGDDDLIGGVGHDWISGGTGSDGVLGDDGRIYTSRNSADVGESLYGISTVEVDLEINGGKWQQSIVYKDGELNKRVNLTPFDMGGNDIIYGGLGGDFLHGGAGDDAMSGAEALEEFYNDPSNPGNVLNYNPDVEEFEAYDENNPRPRILVGEGNEVQEFLLNFDADDSSVLDTHSDAPIPTDGDDRIFGDNGNDWLVGGTGKDQLFGGAGSDLLNVDDDHDSSPGNDDTEAHPSYDDVAFGGSGRDVLIANTANDRLIDWNGEYNSYIVPFSPFGAGTVSRSPQPAIRAYVTELAEAAGADQSLTEPNGELGLTTKGQTGGPADPQPGNGKDKKK